MDKMGGTLSAALRIPMRYIYLAFPIGAVLMLLAFIKMIPEKAKEIKEGRDE
jgi:TRAP-type C4-dicarboxylate transport system permease small subunit